LYALFGVALERDDHGGEREDDDRHQVFETQ